MSVFGYDYEPIQQKCPKSLKQKQCIRARGATQTCTFTKALWSRKGNEAISIMTYKYIHNML